MAEVFLNPAGALADSVLPEGWPAALAARNLDPVFLTPAWDLASLAPDLDAQARQDLALAALLALASEGAGHTRLPLDAPEARHLLSDFGRPDLDLAAFLADPRLQALVGGPGHPLVVEGGALRTGRIEALEAAFASRVADLAGQPLPSPVEVDEDLLTRPARLTEEQRAAVAAALTRPLLLVSGGPGTGKTSIVVAILRALARQPGFRAEDVALAAPTGKAAQRMGEAIRGALARVPEPTEADRLIGTLEPTTLHRLLGWNPATGRTKHHGAHPLPARVVIVDEGSMVGLELMHLLTRALDAGARLIVLGDAEQLPSVEAGCVFRDLLGALPGCASWLRQSFRMDPSDPEGGRVYQLSRALLDPGQPLDVTLRHHAGGVAFSGTEALEGDREAFLDRWMTEVLDAPAQARETRQAFRRRDGAWLPGDLARLAACTARHGRGRLLSPLREAPGLLATAGLNRALHHRWQRLTGAGLRQDLAFLPGEPVLFTTNDHGRQLFNGDQGLVILVSDDGAPARQAVAFPRGGGFAVHPLAPILHALEPAYALTVHKSQGSEFEKVALVLPDPGHPMLTREILYTGVTRARKSVVLLGRAEALQEAARTPVTRSSGLGARLADGPGAFAESS